MKQQIEALPSIRDLGELAIKVGRKGRMLSFQHGPHVVVDHQRLCRRTSGDICGCGPPRQKADLANG
jgi:hypothetical protein